MKRLILLLTLLLGEWSPLRSLKLVVGSRTKRIIFGRRITSRTSGYEAIDYHAWFGIKYKPCPEDHRGGGVLLTPTIVQTACHILAEPTNTKISKSLKKVRLRTLWENPFSVYIGHNNITRMTNGVKPKKFYIHQKCAIIVMGQFETDFWVTHDTGLVLLETSFDDYFKENKLPHKYINYAPQYTIGALAKNYQYAQKTRAACLIFGYGVTELRNGALAANKFWENSTTASLVLHHGWTALHDYQSCYMLTRGWYEYLYEYNPIVYEDLATWLCSSGFGRNDPLFGNGDSGSPVSCNNQYIGTVSQGYWDWIYQDAFKGFKPMVLLTNAIAFTIFENSYEHRIAFERDFLGDYGKGADLRPTFRPRHTPLPNACPRKKSMGQSTLHSKSPASRISFVIAVMLTKNYNVL